LAGKAGALLNFHEWAFCTALKFLPKGTRLFRRIQYELGARKRVALEMFTRWAQCRNNPDALYIKLFSPGSAPCNLQLELIQDVPVYRDNIKVLPGWNEYTLPFEKLDFKPGKNRFLCLWVDRDQEARFIFTWLDLVQFKSTAPAKQESPAEKLKCVAWDLDNTLWKGVIGDDGRDGVKVVPEALELIRKLDERGIIQTIASKNEHNTAWEKVVELGIQNYFLYPAINWNPKSVNLSRIAKELNININSFALIDDSRFEREEVSSAFPQVRVYDPENLSLLLNGAEFDVPVTKEAGSRRLKYLEEISRKSAHQTWDGDLDGFLKSCCIQLNIRTVENQDQVDRCLELLHRSNQFHLSGKRYPSGEFEELLKNSEYDSYVLDVCDRYGNYGIVGFVSVQTNNDAVVVTDFVMSCRVARKKIENAFFHWYLNRKDCCGKNVFARMIVTGRNQPLRQVFDELEFEVVSESDSEVLMKVDGAKIASNKPPISITRF
jgi:FkbH-like protein